MHEFLNLGLAFLEGLALIVSPCILPILPILLSTSLTGSRKRPFGIIIGFILTFALFTFFSRALVVHLHLNLTWLRYASYGLLLIFACVMLSTYLTDKFGMLTSSFANAGSQVSSKVEKEGFGSGLILGSLVGLIWTPCAGPILAAVIVQTALQESDTLSFFTILSFAFGAGVPMLLIAFFGRGMMNKLGFFKTHSHAIRKAMGFIIIGTVVYLILSESSIFPQTVSTPVVKVDNLTKEEPLKLEHALEKTYDAPELKDNEAWINSNPLTLQSLKGKVVLIDFWTYSCINCIRTLPYIKDWYSKYHDKGLEIIGVHTPEFEFEKNLDNVKMAVKKFEISYPVALDSNYATWKQYQNRYWPAHYIVDKEGKVVYTHFGEGEYDITENNLRFLLNIKETNPIQNLEKTSPREHESPETYLGSDRSQNFTQIEKHNLYSFPKSLELDHWALEGNWDISKQHITAKKSNAALKFHFKAKKVFLVMGNKTGKSISVKVRLNGEDLTQNSKGSDVTNNKVEILEHRLYELLSLPQSQDGILEIISSQPGLEAYAFTFGS